MGPMGPMGPKGPKGPHGPHWPMGPHGPHGTPFTYSLRNGVGVMEQTRNSHMYILVMDIMKQHLKPVFRVWVPKPYFPAVGPFKTGRGRVSMHLGLFFSIEFDVEMGGTIVQPTETKHFRIFHKFGEFLCQPFGENT